MQERAEQMLGEAAKKVTACTYHSFCTRMLRKYAFQANLMRDFTVLSASDPATIIDMMIAELGYSEIPNFPTAKQIAGFISDSINRGIPLRMAIQKNRKVVERGGFYGEIENVRKRADAYKRENDLLDYDDLMLRFLELLKDRPDVAEKIDEEFRYISIDEYQDTNRLQAAIIKRIREKNRNLLVVGDDYQSIYGFRGSDIRIIQSFPDDYPGAKIIFLTQNYRSSPQIVNLANEVMHKHAVEDRYKKSLISENPDGPVPFLVSIKNQAAAARVVADNIVAGHNNGRAYKDSLVLVRNSSSFTPVETELVRRGIPYEKRGGPKFFDLKHVKDTLAFIRIFCNPRDELSWFRIVHLIPGVGDVTARNLSAKIRENGEDQPAPADQIRGHRGCGGTLGGDRVRRRRIRDRGIRLIGTYLFGDGRGGAQARHQGRASAPHNPLSFPRTGCSGACRARREGISFGGTQRRANGRGCKARRCGQGPRRTLRPSGRYDVYTRRGARGVERETIKITDHVRG